MACKVCKKYYCEGCACECHANDDYGYGSDDCQRCKGQGVVKPADPLAPWLTCPACKGTGNRA